MSEKSNKTDKPKNRTADEEFVEDLEDNIDAGGCTEAWEAMTEIRNQESETGRRSFLKALGISGAAMSMSTGLVAGKANSASQTRVQEAIESPEVQKILAELGSPSVQRGKATTRKASNVDEAPNGGEKIHTLFEVTVLPTPVGEIRYTEIVGGDTHKEGIAGAQYRFTYQMEDENVQSPSGNSMIESKLPSKYQSLPENTPAMLFTRDDEVVFGREASSDEVAQISDIVELDEDEFKSSTTSSQTGFHVMVKNQQEILTVNISEGEITDQTTLESGYSIQSSEADKWCWRCIQAIGACAGCFIACASVTFQSPSQAIIGCVTCQLATCGGSSYACTKCKQACSCNT
ncbi:twin-arginine translocation signal domain-containing protein [Haloferax sulfurifontis]|nr:twin-arginine translocation signal domain-containing protein [Haloferax sulfurifontis]